MTGQLVWAVTVGDVDGMQFNDRVLTNWYKLWRVFDEPDFTGPMETETIARLENLHDVLHALDAAASN